MNENNNKLIYIAVIITLVLLGVGGYFLYVKEIKKENNYESSAGQYKQNEDKKDDATSEQNEKNGTTTENPAKTKTEETQTQIKEITITGSEFKFKPNLIAVNKGEKVKIIFENTGNYPHNLVIRELNIKTKLIKKGETDIIEFIAPESKTYEFICSVPGHKENGMKGELEVK